jgi:hypothetical protein
MTQTLDLIIAALAPLRAEIIARGRDAINTHIARLDADLAAAGGNLDAAAPRPNGRMGRLEYLAAQQRRRMMTMIANESGRAALLAEAIAAITASFDAFAAKLAEKAGPITAASICGASLWNGSTLTVTAADGTRAAWRTRTILNVSCLGKVFNQYPTRRVA